MAKSSQMHQKKHDNPEINLCTYKELIYDQNGN